MSRNQELTLKRFPPPHRGWCRRSFCWRSRIPVCRERSNPSGFCIRLRSEWPDWVIVLPGLLEFVDKKVLIWSLHLLPRWNSVRLFPNCSSGVLSDERQSVHRPLDTDCEKIIELEHWTGIAPSVFFMINFNKNKWTYHLSSVSFFEASEGDVIVDHIPGGDLRVVFVLQQKDDLLADHLLFLLQEWPDLVILSPDLATSTQTLPCSRPSSLLPTNSPTAGRWWPGARTALRGGRGNSSGWPWSLWGRTYPWTRCRKRGPFYTWIWAPSSSFVSSYHGLIIPYPSNLGWHEPNSFTIKVTWLGIQN